MSWAVLQVPLHEVKCVEEDRESDVCRRSFDDANYFARCYRKPRYKGQNDIVYAKSRWLCSDAHFKEYLYRFAIRHIIAIWHNFVNISMASVGSLI